MLRPKYVYDVVSKTTVLILSYHLLLAVNWPPNLHGFLMRPSPWSHQKELFHQNPSVPFLPLSSQQLQLCMKLSLNVAMEMIFHTRRLSNWRQLVCIGTRWGRGILWFNTVSSLNKKSRNRVSFYVIRQGTCRPMLSGVKICYLQEKLCQIVGEMFAWIPKFYEKRISKSSYRMHFGQWKNPSLARS